MFAQNDAIQQRSRSGRHRGGREANEAAAELPDLQPHFRSSTKNPGGIGGIGRNVDQIGVGCPDRPQNGCEIGRGRGKLASYTILSPASRTLVRAPSVALRANSASAPMIATVCGFGCRRFKKQHRDQGRTRQKCLFHRFLPVPDMKQTYGAG